MRQARLRAIVAVGFGVTRETFTQRVDSKHTLPVAANLLDQDLGAPEANVKGASDITYLHTGEGWLYLAVVHRASTMADLFSRRVVGWSLQASLNRVLVVNALQSALGQRCPATGLVHHSDHGCAGATPG